MEKKELSQLLTSTFENNKEDNKLTFHFIRNLKHMSGEYRIKEIKTGRGKGGSTLAKMINLQTNEEVEQVMIGNVYKSFGTPISDMILNITDANGTLYGLPDSEEMNVLHAVTRDKENSSVLDATMEKLIRAEGSRVKLESDSPEFNGEFIVLNGRRSPGRFAQVILNLQEVSSDRKLELWSYKHSAIVKTITQLAPPGPVSN